jgi:hypothetical protein
MPFDGVKFDKIFPDKKRSLAIDEDPRTSFIPAYEWMQREVGFWPFWVAVGSDLDAIRMTGYDNQWRVRMSYCYTDPSLNEYRKKGEFPNQVLFSWKDLDGVFSCYSAWHLVLCNDEEKNPIKPHEKRMIFKYSWNKARWLRESRKRKNYGVQMVTPFLDLRTANRVWVRNQETKCKLEEMGFQNVKVKRIKLLKDW